MRKVKLIVHEKYAGKQSPSDVLRQRDGSYVLLNEKRVRAGTFSPCPDLKLIKH